MFKKPEDISPLPSGMMNAFNKTIDQQMRNYDSPTQEQASAPEAEASIPEQDLEEDAKSLTAVRDHGQGKSQYKADNEKSTKERTKEVEALVSEGTLKVTNYSGSDAGGQSPKSQGIKVKKVASGRYGDDVEMTGPDAKLIAFAIANLGVDKSAKTIADAQKQINESKKIASEDDDKELDKVDPKADKKKFKDRKDKDLDNDGDTDSSDEYLHKRRQAIAKALAKKKVEESVELDEAKENSYTVVHAKKGKVVVTAPTSYAAAQKAAKQWKLKSTAGVDSYLMEDTDVKKSEREALDEGKMKEFHDFMQKGKSPEFIAKKMGLDLKTVKQLMDHLDESVELDEALKTTHVVIDTADGNKIVSSATNEKQAKSSIVSAERPPLSIKDKKTLKVVQLKKPVSLNKDILGTTLKEESVELDESMDDTLKRLKKMGGVVFGDKLTSKKDDTPAKLASQSRGKKTVYFVVTDDGYTQYKDLGAVKKAWNIAGNTADAKIALDLMSKQGDGDAIDMILNKYKISIDKLDKIVKNNLGAKSAADFLGESVQLDEVRGKLNAKGEIEMTKANFAKVHKDFKTKIKGQPFAMQIDPKSGGSALFPVKFIKEEVALDEAKRVITKAVVVKLLIKRGNNPKVAKDMVEKEFDSAIKRHPDATASRIAEVISVVAEEVALDEGYQVYVKSRTAKSGWIAQGQPHKTEADAKKDAKSFGGVTKIVKEEVALDEAYQQFTDKTPNWGEDQALTYGRKKGYKEVAVMGDGKGVHAMVLFALNSEDKKFVKGANVKSGETVFRYTTKISIAGDIFPLVKVNIAKGIFYPLTQESSDGSIETAKFETRGVKLKFFRSLEGVKLESIEEAKMKEGNTFTKALAAARLNGDDEFIVSGKKYSVAEHAEELDEAVDSADIDDMKATKGDKESAKMNIIVQLRKAADVKGNLDIVFANGKKQKLPANIIKIALDKFNSFRKPVTKEKLVTAMSKSYKDMLVALKTIKEYSE